MSDRTTTNRWILILIVVLCAAPMLLALLLFQNPHWISGRTNYGNLVMPVVPIERSALIGLDDFSRQNLDELKGHWVLLQVVTADGCQAECRASLHKTKQIRLMLNKDLLRLRRALVISPGFDQQQASDWWAGEDYLLRVSPGVGLIDVLSTAIGQPLKQGMVFVMDPSGNVLMWYQPGFDPYGVKKDLKRLLSVSQIG